MSRPKKPPATLAVAPVVPVVVTHRRTPWQRLALSLLGIAIIFLMWRWATNHLYTLPEHSIVAFQAITTHALYGVVTIVIFLVTGKLIYDWKNSSTVTTGLSEILNSQNANPNPDRQ